MTGHHTIFDLSRLGVLLIASVLLFGCATAPDSGDLEAVAEYQKVNDPAEPTMRAIFAANRAIDRFTLKPLAAVYREVIPAFVRQGVYNFLNNLRAPVILFNDLLQGKVKRAGTTVARFVINSTIGVGGVGDMAADLGFEHHDEDFGQTLAVWGIPEGPYTMLPLFGPSNPRDAIGLVVDYLIDPLNLWASNTERDWIIYSRTGVRAVSERARNFDAYEDMEKSSLDFYAAVRSLYRQRRADEIGDGRGSANAPVPGISQRPNIPSFDVEEASRKN